MLVQRGGHSGTYVANAHVVYFFQLREVGLRKEAKHLLSQRETGLRNWLRDQQQTQRLAILTSLKHSLASHLADQ